MCGKVNNNRPAPKPPVVSPEAPNAPAVVSPESPQRAQRQSLAPRGHSMQDVFEGGRCKAARTEKPNFLQKLGRMLQKVERFLPQLQNVMEWLRGIIGDTKKNEPAAPFIPR